MATKNTTQKKMDRRDFIKGSSLILSSMFLPFSIEILNPGEAPAAPAGGNGEITTFWNSCNVNCGSRCALRVHVQDGKIIQIETDNTGDDTYGLHQLRACPRGRSMRQRIYAEERIPYPLKRVGKRGEGKFERISWEQAYTELGQRLKKTIDEYGNEAVYLNYGTGALGSTMGKSWPPDATPVARLMNLAGGYLNHYSDYSTIQITIGMPYLYGGSWVDGNSLSDMENSKLAVFFGNNPSETRMSGCKCKTLQHARFTNNTRVIVVDPRYTDTIVSSGDEWIPILPGTDTALCAALAYVMITEDLVDISFIRRYTMGFDEESLPEGAEPGSSYKSYILGQGPDKTPKTPEWAAEITTIPVHRIQKLAREIALTKPCFICQGWGPQRTTNGENLSRAVGMLAVLTGNVGIAGGNTGAREASGQSLPMATFPTLENPVKTSVSCFNWFQAIEDHTWMTAETAGIKGRDRLIAPIKFIWNYASNCLTNQHGGINQMNPILQDEEKCETILVIDTTLTASARYADYLLPCCSNLEEHDWTADGDSNIAYVIFAEKCIEPLHESRGIYDICAGIAEQIGLKEEFTEGRTQYQWMEHLYDQSKKAVPDLPPTLEDAFKQGIYKKYFPENHIAYKAFRDDPEANPLDTASGKIEIYAPELAEYAKTWKLDKGQRITALPEHIDDPEGAQSPMQKKYPLQMVTYHYKQRTHSTYGNCSWLQEVSPQELWINPLDARARGIKHTQRVKVFNDRGVTYVEAKVTPRIIPGVVGLPEGAWHKPNKKGEDMNGCPNVLTRLQPTALAKGNPHHSTLIQVEKA
ncbi:MAG: DMSO/selenate family reductase complex A subunit [Desulfobacterium sp.]|nr:DMSO/selenate family reductase complex A subunit [Desulfobacterium sp.]